MVESRASRFQSLIFSRSGRRLFRKVAAFGLTAAMVASLAVAVAEEPAQAVPAAAKPKAAAVSSRPDLVSAQITARSQGSRVEVESLRNETSTTWVNPDGSLTTQQHLQPIRFRDRSHPDAANPPGAWRDVDLEMTERADGTVGPKGHVLGLSLAGAGKGADGLPVGSAGTDLAAAHEEPGKDKAARQVSIGWGGRLGKPILSGTTATYQDVEPGVDLVMDARRTGFETHLVINTPDALARLKSSAAGGEVAWRIPVKTKGLTARAESDGSVSFVAAGGTVASRFAPPVAWDAAVDVHSGNAVNTSPVAMAVAQTGNGRAVLTLTPDQAWLFSADRKFPLTIDPTYASGGNVATSFDTYVSSAFPTAAYSTDTELRVGTYNGGGDKYRSFLNFPLASFSGKDITSASLSLYEFHSWSCTAKPFYAYNAAGASSSTTWNTQPAAVAQQGSLTVAKGYSSSCAAGRVSVPITALISSWSKSTGTTGTVRLTASETDNLGWKKFYSVESSQDPYITFSYNRKPNPAAAPTLQSPPGVSYVNPSTGVAALYTSDSTPLLSSKATDSDASTVQMTIEVHNSTTTSSTSLKSTCTTAFVASGATGSCSSTTALADNVVYYARVAVKDDRGLWNGAWSAWTTFRTAIAAPPAPVISCPAPYTNGSWNDTLPAAPVSCTVTGAGTGTTAPAFIQYSLDGAAYLRKAITPSSNASTAKITVSVPNTAGAHSLKAYTQSATSVNSATTTSYAFGYGGASMSLPAASPRVTTTGSVIIAAAGPPKGASSLPTAKVRWRIASSGQDESSPYWNDATSASLTVTDNGANGVAVSGSWNAMAETVDGTDTDPNTAGVQTITLNPRVPVLLDVQVCLTYASGAQCTWSQSKPSVMRVPHAFGNAFPTAETGPGQVALFTGEFNADVTDASVPGYTGSISLSRSHSTYGNAPGVPTDAVTGVFGPGWTASLEGSDVGVGGLQAVDSTRADGTIAFVETDGTALVYLAPCTGTPCVSRRTSAANLTAGTYTPVDEDTDLSGTTLSVAGAGAGTTLTLTEDDGTRTVFSPATAGQAPTATAAGLFSPTSVTESGSLTTSYSRDSAGRVTRILAPIPPGIVAATGRAVSCPDGPVTGLDKGCRALRISYGDGTTATGNTPAGQVWQVTAELYNPAILTTKDCAGAALSIGVGVASVPVACYTYDAGKRLTSVKDPRTGLATSYTYGSANQLTSITPAGQSAITLAYSTLESRLKLTAVTRLQPAPLSGTANLTRVVYGVPTSGAGLPDLGAGAVDDWSQASAPTYAAAVFGPDYTGTISQADGVAPTASDWSYADLYYTTGDGYTVNTARYGAGAWQRTSTDYDAQGNVARTLDAGAITAVTTQGLAAGVADLYSTKTVYNADIKNSTGTVVTPAGSMVTDTYGPLRNTVLADGTTAPARPHTHTTFDEDAPNQVDGVGINPASGAPWRLPTTETTTAADGAGNDISGQTVSTTSTLYTAQVSGTADGWALGSPTKVTTGGIATVTGYDSTGRTIETRQPMSTGTDAGTTRSVYYTADASATDSRCDDKPEWAGLPCATGPAATPSTTATPANGPASLPSSLTSAYSIWLAATTTVESSGTATRTNTITMDAAGRTTKTLTTSTIPGSTARPAVYTHYDPTTGQADYTGPLDQTSSQGTTIADADRTTSYDAWGRPTTTRAETATAGVYDTTVTTYDTAGRVSTVTDPKGTTTTIWDGTDSNTAQERRGLPTKVTVTRVGAAGGSGTFDFTGAYDPDGTLTIRKLPGSITQTTTFDEAGEPTGLTYDGQVTPVTQRLDANNDPVFDENGDPVFDAGTPTRGTWLAWTQDNDITGRVRQEYTGAGSSFDPSSSGATSLDQVVAPTGNATAYDRGYTYDGAGRLVTVKDRTAITTGTTLDPGTAPTTDAPCTARSFTFDNNGRRTQLVTDQHTDGDCAATPTSTSSTSYAYDTADRPTVAADGSGTYTYDAFGRQTVIPAADAPLAGGNITLGYYDDDLARTVAQGTTTTTLGLDSGGRRLTATTISSAGTSTLERHFADASDNPTWTVRDGVVTRYAESLGGDLSLAIHADGSADLSLATLHGDIVTTVPVPATVASTDPAVGIDGWSDYTEYGMSRDPAATTQVAGDGGYGWLGAQQRSTTTANLSLMGDRLYNPATGRFTSLDPEPGGNANAYSYPDDPINMYDLDGHWGHWKKWAKAVGAVAWKYKWDIALTVATFIPGVGVAAWAVRGASWGARAYRGYEEINTARRVVSASRAAISTAKRWKSYVRLGRGASGHIRLSIGQTKKYWKASGRGPQWNLHIERKYAAFNHYGRKYYRKFWGD